MKRLFFILLLGCAVMPFSACDKKEGPAEELGEAIDEAGDDLGDALDEAKDKLD